MGRNLMSSQKKKVRMKDIADKLNISVNAVSLALNNKAGVSSETRQKVLEIANELEYVDRSPSLIKKNQLNNICLMIEERNFKDVRFYSSVILGIESEAKKNNYDLIVTFIDKNNYTIPSSIEQKKVSGIIIVGTVDDEYLKRVLYYGIPIIQVDNASFSINTDAVLTQNISGAYMATKYLIDNNHKEIGFFGEKDLTLSFYERWIGFNKSMEDNGLTIDEKLCLTNSIENYALKNDYKAVKEIIEKMDKLPTAWVCANDSAAVTLINALNIINIRVPDDISVIGFDDIDLCKAITPNLTTIRINKNFMGAQAVRNLLWRMENIDEPNYHTRMAVELIERKSVKRI